MHHTSDLSLFSISDIIESVNIVIILYEDGLSIVTVILLESEKFVKKFFLATGCGFGQDCTRQGQGENEEKFKGFILLDGLSNFLSLVNKQR